MTTRSEKHRRLLDFRARVPWISQSALASILRIAREEELPDCNSARDIRDARDSLAKTATPYGTLHQDLKIGSRCVEMQSPHAMLYHCVKTSAALTNIMKETAARRPPSPEQPWRVIMYADEVAPGNQLAYKNTRKIWAVYWSFLDFGAAALSDEASDVPKLVMCSLGGLTCVSKVIYMLRKPSTNLGGRFVSLRCSSAIAVERLHVNFARHHSDDAKPRMLS